MMFTAVFWWTPDSGDTRTLTEATEEETAKDDEIQPDHDTLQVSTRSGR